MMAQGFKDGGAARCRGTARRKAIALAAAMVLALATGAAGRDPVPLPEPRPVSKEPVAERAQPIPAPMPRPRPDEDADEVDDAGGTSLPPRDTGVPGRSDAEDSESPPPDPPDTAGIAEDGAALDACLKRLDALGTHYAVGAPINDAGRCGIAVPLTIRKVAPGVALRPSGVMRCATALALAEWTRTHVMPAAETLGPAVRLAAIRHASAYVCRRRNGAENGRLSEHALGNAVDIAGFSFEGHAPLVVAPRHGDGDRAEAFQRAARSTACLAFTTVLGPGTDAAHSTHLHLDIIDRGGYRICQ